MRVFFLCSCSYAVVGCPPEIMGIGPAVAIPVALERAGLTTKQIDLYEINEAFASQAVYSVKKLGLSWVRVCVLVFVCIALL